MELDARRLPDGSRVDTDVCIIGAGPAGIALARELLGANIDVLLVESGGWDADEWSQALNEGTVAGSEYAGLRLTRHRRVGGSTAIWNTPVGREQGAKYLPLDPWDFDPPRGSNLTGWPIGREFLDPFYRRAQAVCGLGPFGYESRDWDDPRRPPFALPGGWLDNRVYQFGRCRPFTAIYPGQIRESANVRLCIHATVCGLVADGRGGRVVEARVATPAGQRHTVRATTYVLAAGAIENPRLLLVSGLGNDLVGCCFMEHPRDHALTLLSSDPELYARAAFYDAHHSAGGTVVGGRLALSEAAVRDLGLPNASLTLLPRPRASPPDRGVMGRVLRRLRHKAGPGPRGGYGWSRLSHPERYFDAFRVLVNLEQRPRPANRVILGTDRDALGVPRPVLHWRWRAEEQLEMVRLRTLLVSSLEAAGLGRVEVDSSRPADPNAHHHSGTTRMAGDPRDGVVDPDGRVHGTANLFVSGASVFPTAGFANPTLTVVALAIRLADHIKARAGAS